MKNVFIGLLIAAAATASYFIFFNKKKETTATNAVNKELIIGKWVTATTEPVADSARPAYRYEFTKEGTAYRSVSDSAKADTLNYSWKDASKLLLKESAADSVGTEFTVNRITADSLEITNREKLTVLFTKMK